MALRPDAELDLRGLKCPLPVVKSRRRLADLHAGATLAVETTDPLAVIDIPHFCTQDGHSLVECRPTPAGHYFLIRKGEAGGT